MQRFSRRRAVTITLSEKSNRLQERLADYPLVQALCERRSRRFGKGMRLSGGPLSYASDQPPQPLTLEEEAALAFAACGITGYALAELPYQTGQEPESGSGNIMAQFVGRTVASADALHIYTVFVINDDGVWMLKRPQDFARHELAELILAAQADRFVELYLRSRVQIADTRLDAPRVVPFTHPFNKWSANVPGTTTFLPVAELTAPYLNGLLYAFDTEYAAFPVDERNWYRPAGVARFARSHGGQLYDGPSAGRTGPVSLVETWLYESATVELGGIIQNLALMAQALGLGGFPHCTTHPYGWLQALGFRMAIIPATRIIGAGPLLAWLARGLGKDMPVPTAVGLERDGEVLIKPYSPPYYRSMEQAVRAFVEFKYACGSGTLRDGGGATAWRDGAAIQRDIPPPSEAAIEATIAYSSYLYRRYGRFPANSGPFRTVSAYQAQHLDGAFYNRFYRSEASGALERDTSGDVGYSKC
jgi:hypothetical protein